MKNEKSIQNVSEAILSASLSKSWEFASILQKIKDVDDQTVFKEIWATALQFDNWKSKDLNEGYQKTVALMKEIYKLEERVATLIANAAAYQWK